MHKILHTPMVQIGIHFILLLPPVHASVYFQTFRVDCEPLCQKIQPFTGYCPVYGSCQWYCHEKHAECPTNTRYHCARNLNAQDTFVAACAQETFCRAGEEPRISKYNVSSEPNQGTASVFCRPCSIPERFNAHFNTSSATYSECPNVKTNLCTEQAHKMDCGYVAYRDLTKTDGFCRCDARSGYATHSAEMCFYENKHCFQKKCPAGEELLLDYSCAKICQIGFARLQTSDICRPTEINMSITISTQSSSNDHSYMMTTTLHGVTGNKPFRTPIEGKNTIVLIVVLLSLMHITVLVIGVNWFIQYRERCSDGRKKSFKEGTGIREEIELIGRPPGGTRTLEETETRTELKNNPSDKDASEALRFETTHFKDNERSKLSCPGTVILNRDDTRTDSPESITTRADLNRYKPEYYPGQQTMQIVLQNINDKSGYKWKTCLEIIRNDTDLRKLDEFEMGQKDPYFTKVRKRIDVPEYQPYTIPGIDRASLYELVSVLLCGNKHMQEIIRLAVARSALMNYTQNAQKLLNKFINKENSVQEATLFFKAHGIDFKATALKRAVEQYYMNLVREIICEGKCKGPFHVELLRAVLNCNIVQYFEDDCFYGQDVHKEPSSHIVLHPHAPDDRELCFYWLRTGFLDSDQYIIVPLFKQDHVDPSKHYLNASQEQCKGVIEEITAKSSFSRTETIEMISKEVRFDFDCLKTARTFKPKEPFDTAIASGFTAYERPGNETSCLYEWISYLFCSSDLMKYIVHLAAARFAMENFDKYAKKLSKVFKTSDNPASDAELFFKLHGIECQISQDLEKDVRTALAALVRDTVNEGKGNGPLFADFLCGALNYQLARHFENNRYRGLDVGTIPALNVTLTSKAPSGRETHLLWRESSSDQPETCRILRLIKDKDPKDDLGIEVIF